MVEVKKKGGGGHPSSSSSSLTEDERRALRGSKFAPLPAHPPPLRSQTRLAHPGGPLTTNKAAALAKFLERKLQQPDGLTSINPDILELAVKNAKETVNASKGEASNSGRIVRHVASFGDSPEDSQECLDEDQYITERKKLKKNKRKKVVRLPEASMAVVKHKKKHKKKLKKKSS